MRFSNKSTLFLCLVLMSVFVALPVIAHQPPAGQTFKESHDGVRNSDTQNDAEFAAETGHSHLAQPTAPTVTLIDLKVGAAPGTSTVESNSVQLTTSDGATPPVYTLTDLTGQNNGQFQVKITFAEPVYAAADSTSAADADLVAADLTITAAKRSASNANIFSSGNVTVASVARMADDATTTAINENLNTFIVTFQVDGSVFHDGTAAIADSFPIDVWITVKEDVLFNLDGSLVKGVEKSGRGNIASSIKMFSVVETLPTAPVAPASLMATPGNGQVVLTWGVVTGATSYQYSSDGGTTWVAVPGSTGTTVTYTVTGLMNSTAYNFQVRAVNAVGPGAAHASVSATPMGDPPPDVAIEIVPGAAVKQVMLGTGKIGASTNALSFTLKSMSALTTQSVSVQNGVARVDKLTDVVPAVAAVGTTPAVPAMPATYNLQVSVNPLVDGVTITAGSGFKLTQIDPADTADMPMAKDIASGFMVTVDRTAPMVTAIDVAGALKPSGGAFNVLIKFSEPLSATPAAANFTVVNGAISDFLDVSTSTVAQYSAKVTPAHGIPATIPAQATPATTANTAARKAAMGKQYVVIRLNAGVMDEFGNASVAGEDMQDATSGAHTAEPFKFMPLMATTALTVDAVLSSSAPASGGNVSAGSTIALTFDKDPGTVTITGGTITTSGASRTLSVIG